MTSIAILVCCIQVEAQKYLNIYQDGLVIKKILAADVDSLSMTDKEPYNINMWKGGQIFQSFAYEEVDSIKVIDEKGGPLSYLGIIGFNSDLYPKNISLLSNSTVSQHKSFIDKLPKKDGTILYYAVDSALYVLQNADIKTPLSSINFVTFTDGLDQGSIMKNPNYLTSDSYLQAIRRRIKDTSYSGLKMNAYTIGLRGKDVSDADMFRRNLISLASSDQNAFEVSNISELRTRLQEIANKIINVNTRQTVSVKIPGVDNGTIVRFTFDGNSPENSQLYIQGTLNLSDYSLRDVTYHGIKARSGSIVQGTKDGIFITFTFRGLRQEEGDAVLPTKNIKQYNCLPTSTAWQINSEFRPDNDTQRIVSYSGTLIVLVLDCSSSLGNDFSKMQSYAKEFADMVAKNTMPFTFESPRNVKAEMDAQSFACNVSWDAVKGADYYQVYRSSGSSYSNYELVAESVSSNTWTDRSPLSGSNYYKVCAVGLGLTSDLSSASSRIDYTLSAPQNVNAAIDDTEYAVNVSWDEVKYADHYQVYRSSTGYSSSYELVADNITSCSWKDKSPQGSDMYYKVYAVCQEVVSSASNSVSVYLTLNSPQNVQSELTVSDNKLAINIKWDAVKYAECYQIYRMYYTGRYSSYELIADSVKTTSFIDESSLDGSNYYMVKALGHGLTSPESNSIGPIDKSKMSVPKNVAGELILNNDNYVIKVSWNAINIAEKYQVYRSNNSWGTYDLIADDVTMNSWIDPSPLMGSNYYKVVAIGHGLTSDQSEASTEVRFITTAPTEVTAELTLKNDMLVINVSWSAVENAESYTISRSNNFNGTYTDVALDVKTNSWTDESPLQGSNYYKIVTVNHGLTSDPIFSNMVSCSLETPKNVTCKLAEEDEKLAVNVTWDAVTYAESYNVYRSANSWFEDSKLVAENVTSNSWKDESPQNNNYYKVCAVGHGLVSGLSNISNGLSCSINRPTNFKAVLDDTDFIIHLTWNAVNHADRYQVYRSFSSSYSGYELIADNITSCSWDDKSSKGSYVYYKVYAISGEIKSSESNYVSVYCSLNTPENLKGDLDWKDDKLVVNLSWDAVKYAEGYQVYRKNGRSYSLIADSVKSASFTDLDLKESNYYRVKAIGHGLASSESNTIGEFKNSMPVPKNVSGELVLDDNNSLVINVTWDAIKIAEKYQIYRSKTSNGTYELISEEVNTNSWTDRSPLAGSNYYSVVAVGHGYTSEKSSPSAEVKCSLAVPTDVAGELALNTNGFVINLSWNSVNFAEGYTIWRSNEYNGTFTKLAENVATNSWTDESPIAGNNYYRVQATGHGLTSDQGRAQNAVNCSLSVPNNFKSELAVNGNKLVINVSWDEVMFAEKYNVYRSNSYNGTYSVVGRDLTSTSWIDDTPLNGNNYYKVEAVGHGLNSQKSSYSGISYSLSAPQDVTGNMVLTNNQLVANIAWSAVPFAESYVVYRSRSYSGEYVKIAENVTTTSWNDEAPLEGNNYYKVAACGYGLTSQLSSYTYVQNQ